MIKKKKNIILGGGIAGLSAAYFLQENRVSFLLYEQDSRVGGLCKTEISDVGYLYDYTGHLLHFSDPYIQKLVVNDLLKDNIVSYDRKSFIYLKNRYIKYPFQKNLYGLPFFVKMECFFGYFFRKWSFFRDEGCRTFFVPNELDRDFRVNRPMTLKNWSFANFGRGISKYFMIPYNEKLWQLDADKMSISWMRGYVPKPSFFEVLKSTFFDSANKVGYNAKFYYPKDGGIQKLAEAFSDKLSKDKIFTNAKITDISIKNKTYAVRDNKADTFDNLITTAPLKKLVLEIIRDCDAEIVKKAKKLHANAVLNINVTVKALKSRQESLSSCFLKNNLRCDCSAENKIFDKHWIYFPEKEFIFYRAGFISPNKDVGSIYTEIATKEQIKVSEYKEYENRVISDLIKAKIIKDTSDIIDIKILNLEPAYVLYDKEHDKIVKEILDYLKVNNIYSIGRYGSWKYSAIEDAILDGKNAAEQVGWDNI